VNDGRQRAEGSGQRVDRREFVKAAAVTGVALAAGAPSASGAQAGQAPRAFKLRYAPHFGMFRQHAPGGLVAELDSLLSLIDAGTLWDVSPFDTAAPELRRVADIAFSGDGEPTTPPAFPAAAEAVRQARDRHRLRVPLRAPPGAGPQEPPRAGSRP